MCSCLSGCLACCVPHWSLQAVGWSQILVPKWGPLRDLIPINIPWVLKFTISPVAWTRRSHHRSSDPIPGLGTKTLQAMQHGKRKEKKRKKGQKRPWGWQGLGSGPVLPEGAQECGVSGPGLQQVCQVRVGRGDTGHVPFLSPDPLKVSPHLHWFSHCELAPPSIVTPPLPQLPLRRASPIPPPLFLSSSSPDPHVLPGHIGIPLFPLGVQGPPPAPTRCPSYEETRTLHPSTPPSYPSYVFLLKNVIHFLKKLFIYLLLAALGLHWVAWASHCSGLSCCRARALGSRALVVVALGL